MCNDHGKTYALYAITVFRRNHDGSEDCWKTYRRYSDFHDFHMRITEQVGGGAADWFVLIWDPAVLLGCSRNSGGGGGGETVQSLGRKPETERGGVRPCFVTKIFYRREAQLREWMKLPEGFF